MDDEKAKNRTTATIGWSLLFIWWGIAMMVHPITIGLTAAGTGVIMLGVNAVRLWQHLPTLASTTIVGAIALLWGSLDHVFSLSFSVSCAVLLITIGVVSVFSLLLKRNTV
jgi:hypothetical protein